jgi:SAM-dependent methyltransferase
MTSHQPNTASLDKLKGLLDTDKAIELHNAIPTARIIPKRVTLAMGANASYFGHPRWGQLYFGACHRDPAFIDRWQAATGSWSNKVVVDIGCGAGNIYASVGGDPELLVGVDISCGALRMAQQIGYQPLCADAQELPLKSACADIVVMNATLHHCDDMKAVLKEAARLVKPGGVLVTDHDLQLSAWNFKGLGWLLWELRLPLYRILKRGGHGSEAEQLCALASEAHHHPGDGLTTSFYQDILRPLGFNVNVYPHSHKQGAVIFQRPPMPADLKFRFVQWLSGIDPHSSEAALSLMCVAQRPSSHRQTEHRQQYGTTNP